MNAYIRMALVAATLSTASAQALALWGDRLELFASDTVTRDSNLFRISKNRDAAAFIGSSDKSDTYNTAAVGFNLDIPVSLQRLRAGASFNQVRYDRFSHLNFNGHDAHALWLWQVGNSWSGQLGATKTEALASFTDFQGPTANPLKNQRIYGDAAYLFTPSWQLKAGLAQTAQRNGNVLRQDNDVDLSDADVTASYISTAGNRLGLSVRQQEGRYPSRQLVTYDNAYTQRSVGAVADWTPTGKSHLNARIDRVQRDYEQFPQRDFDGTTYRAAYDWKATGKFTLTAVAYKDISTVEDIQTNFVLVKGVALKPSFAFTDKLRLLVTADYSKRDYLGDPTLGTTPDRTNRVRLLGATLSYQALRTLSLLLSGRHESRSSTAALNDYSTDIVSINARLSF